MPKLATPLQYEPSLDGLNAIRPLQLADESKVIISYPALCQNPPSIDKPAVGLFGRCSQQGSLLVDVPAWATKVYEVDVPVAVNEGNKFYIFPITVQGVLACWSKVGEYLDVGWTNDIYSRTYIYIPTDYWKYLPFMGTKIHFSVSGAPDTLGTIHLIGFY